MARKEDKATTVIRIPMTLHETIRCGAFRDRLKMMEYVERAIDYYEFERFHNDIERASESAQKEYLAKLEKIAKARQPPVCGKTDPAKDIGAYATHMKGKPPKTVGLYLTAVRSYYGLNGHVFNKQELKRIVPKTGDAETHQGELTTEILRKMVGAADIRGRVMIMLLASTACRIGELCEVKLDDVNMSSDPARIRLRKEYTKNGRTRTVFLTDECKEVVSIWLRSERMKYLTASYQRNEGLNDTFRDKTRLPPEKDQRLLGLSTYGARSIWYTTLSRVLDKDKLKPDEKTHIHPLSPHVVRKWWRIAANQGFQNEDVAHLIMGHWNNSLDFVYAKMGDEGLGKEFKKAQMAISILTGEDVKGMKEKQGSQENRILALERENAAQRAEIVKLHEMFAESLKIVQVYQNAQRGNLQ